MEFRTTLVVSGRITPVAEDSDALEGHGIAVVEEEEETAQASELKVVDNIGIRFLFRRFVKSGKLDKVIGRLGAKEAVSRYVSDAGLSDIEASALAGAIYDFDKGSLPIGQEHLSMLKYWYDQGKDIFHASRPAFVPELWLVGPMKIDTAQKAAYVGGYVRYRHETSKWDKILFHSFGQKAYKNFVLDMFKTNTGMKEDSDIMEAYDRAFTAPVA